MTSLSESLQEAYFQFESYLNIIGWKFKYFCFDYYENKINENCDDEIEANRFYEKEKKKKQRKRHKINELQDFINYITGHNDFKKKGVIKPFCICDEDFSPEFEREMKKISELVSEKAESYCKIEKASMFN